MSDLLLGISFRTTTCCHQGCGIAFAMEHHFYNARRDDHAFFYCPRGHSQHFTGESEAEKYKRLYENEQARLAAEKAHLEIVRADRDHNERRARSLRGVVTRTKNRVGRGVCPCCSRTFKQLAAHMKSKHPAYVDGGSED